MNKLSKIGISALAGSLAVTAANAAEFSVSGGTELTYARAHDAESGNPLGMKSALGFSASGDVNGYGVSYYLGTADKLTLMTSANIQFDLGDIGKVTFDQNSGAGGALKWQRNPMPTAYEEVWHNVASSAYVGGAFGAHNALSLDGTQGIVSYTLRYDPIAAGDTSTSGFNGDGAKSGAGATLGTATEVILSAAPAEGVKITGGYGSAAVKTSGNSGADAEQFVSSIKVTRGPVSVGVGLNTYDTGTHNTASQRQEMWGVAFNVNDNLSISYGQQDIEYENVSSAHTTAEGKGFSASYTMGSAALRYVHNEVDAVAGVAGTSSEYSEVSLNLSF